MPHQDKVGMIHDQTGNVAFTQAFAFQRFYSKNGWRLVRSSDERSQILRLAGFASLTVSHETSSEKIVDLLTSAALPDEDPAETDKVDASPAMPPVTPVSGSTASPAGKKEK